ncbi:uncharacterized protein LOC110901091 [Helianthus annuus]|uniref:uncharacterized protein LOC110901091 n=1 Tax=Helianthus annuus TaxID=4232 RepID=UPI000B8F9D6D|nr:uncharacterized protein LOC110901091 [Helianthus annuus]
MSSSESGLSDTVDPMAIISDDEIVPEPEIFTSDTESDPEMMSDDDDDEDDDFQPFALPDFGDDVLHVDGLPDEDPFLVPILDQDHLILGHPDGELVVVPILAPLPLAAFPLEDLPFDDLSDDDVDLFIDDSFESVSSSTLHALGLQRYPTDSDTDTALSIAPTPPHDFDLDLELDIAPDDQPVDAPSDPEPIPADPEPMPAPEPLPDHDPVPLCIPDIAPLIPDLIPAPADPAAFASQVDPRYAFTSNGWIADDDDDIPAPRPGEGPSSQQPSHVPHVSAAFPHMSQYAPTTHFTSAPSGESLIWFPPNTMPVSDPYHPSHFIGYMRDELLLSLQLQQEILCRRVMELERTPRPPPCSCPSPFATPPAPLLPYPDFDVRFLTMEQQITYLLRHIYDLEEELAHVRNLLFVPPPPPPLPSA